MSQWYCSIESRCRKFIKKFCPFSRGFTMVKLRINLTQKQYCTIVFYIMDSWVMLEFFQCACDIDRFSNRKWVLTMCTIGKSENIRGIPKSTGFISVLNALVICVCFKIYFLIDHHCKIQSELSDMLKNSPNLPNFLQWVNECRAPFSASRWLQHGFIWWSQFVVVVDVVTDVGSWSHSWIHLCWPCAKIYFAVTATGPKC